MSYVSGACSIIQDEGIRKLSTIGFALKVDGYTVETPDDYVKTKVQMLGHSMPCTLYKLRVTEGVRAGKEVVLRCRDVKFTDVHKQKAALAVGKKFLGFYRSDGRRVLTEVEVVSAEESADSNNYFYGFNAGSFVIGTGLDPVFLYGHFTEHEEKK